MRPYSWPCILAFVDEWVSESQFSGARYSPDQIVPKTLYLPDGRRVPVCVVRAPRELNTPPESSTVQFPLNNIGGGRPILARVQGQEHFATVACLVRDGHKVYALTNRHVTGEEGEILYTRRAGLTERIGVASAKQLTRIPFMDVYPGFIGKNAYVNLDIGLVDIDNLDDWTAQIEGLNGKGTMGPLADLSVQNLSLALIGCHVRGHGSASGSMLGEIHALFYRYKSQGGFDYIADFFIGPRTNLVKPKANGNAKKPPEPQAFATHPGDSGRLWLLEPRSEKDVKRNGRKEEDSTPPYPLLSRSYECCEA